MEAYQAKQMSEKNFVPNVAPSASSGIIFFSRVGSSWGWRKAMQRFFYMSLVHLLWHYYPFDNA